MNAGGTLNILQNVREHCIDAPVIHCSTNKVYGDRPNSLPLIEQETRWEIDPTHTYADGIREDMSIDATLHSVFGASKVAADVMVQEYGRYFGMKTACFRGGTLTGPAHSATELHGFLGYVMRCAMERRTYNLFGYKGKQVRDAIHSHDVINAFEAFFRAPRSGAVYNLGGGRHSNCSNLEAFALAEEISGNEMIYEYKEANRVGDHQWWIGSNATFQADYPEWQQVYDVPMILTEIYEANVEQVGPEDRSVIDEGKHNVLGVMVSAVDYDYAADRVITAAHERKPLALTALAVHGVMTGVADPEHNARLNAFDLVTPDGQPVRWALGALHGVKLADRVYGPTLTLRVLERCAAENLPIYLYGSTDETLAKLVTELHRMFPTLRDRRHGGVEVPRRRRGRRQRDRGSDRHIGRAGRARRPRLPAARGFHPRHAAAAGHAVARRRCRLRLPRRPAAETAGVDAEVLTGVALAARSRTGAALAAIPDPQPGLPDAARRAEDRHLEGHAAGADQRAGQVVRRLNQ